LRDAGEKPTLEDTVDGMSVVYVEQAQMHGFAALRAAQSNDLA